MSASTAPPINPCPENSGHSIETQLSVGNAIFSKEFLKLSGSHFLVDVYASFMTPLLPLLALKFSLSTGIAGVFIALSALSSSIMQPYYGSLMDRWPRINFALIGFIMAISIVFIGISNSLWLTLGFVFLSYMGNGIYHPCTITHTAHLAEHKQKNTMMGIFFSMGTLGFAFGPMLSAYLVDHGGLHMTVWAGAGLFLGLPLLYQLQNNHKTSKKLKQSKVEKHQTIQSNRFNWPFKPRENQLLLLLCTIGFVRFFGIIGLQTYMPFIWTKAGYSLSTIGTVLGLSTLMGVPLVVVTSKLADSIGEKSLHLLTIFPALALSILLFQVQGMASFIVFILLIGILFSSQATNIIIALRYIKHSNNMVSGIMNGITIGIAGILMPVVGWAGDLFGLTSTLQWLMPPVILLGITATLMLPNPKRFRKTFQIIFNKKPVIN